MAVINIQTAPPTGLAAVTSQVSMTQSTLPSVIYIQTTDTYATVTTTGYLTHFKQEGFTFSSNQMALVYTTDDGPVWLQVAITYANSSVLSAVISLVEINAPGDVVLPTVSTQLAMFNNTSGQLIDSGILVANVMAKNAVNTMAAGSQIIADKATAVTTAGAATVNKMSGVLTTPALTTASGSAYSIALTNSEIAATSVLLCQVQGGTNTTPGITVVATPGTGSATILLQNSGVAAVALNGTVIVSFVVL